MASSVPHTEYAMDPDEVHSVSSASDDNDSLGDHIDSVPSHPLQSLDDEYTSSQEHADRALLDASGEPNVSRPSSVLIEELRQKEVEPMTLEKGLQNVRDTTETVALAVDGELPTWLNAEVYTVGPGTFDVRYTRKIEIDGHLQSATGTFTFGHLLDGLPLVNRFDLSGEHNTIQYKSRLTSRRLIEKIHDHHGYAPCHPAGLFHTHANQTVLIKFIKSAAKASKPDGEPCSARILTHLPGIDGQLFCQNLANHIQELDPFDLKPKRVLTWSEVNPAFAGYSSCANGVYDASTGEYINFTMEIGYSTTRYHFFSTSSSEPRGALIATVPNAPTGYVHSFAVTPQHVVLVVFPLLAHSSAVKYAWNESIMDACSFYQNEPTVFYVISRKDKRVVASYQAASCFAFNHVNAYEDDQGIFVDLVAYKDDAIARHLSTAHLRDNDTESGSLPPSELRRYLLHNLQSAMSTYAQNQTYVPTVSSITARLSSLWTYARGNSSQHDTSKGRMDVVDDDVEQLSKEQGGWSYWMPVATYTTVGHDIEMATVHPAFQRKAYTFVYGVGLKHGIDQDTSPHSTRLWDRIVKWNTSTRTMVASWHQDGCYPGEPQFVPRDPAGNDEEDGVLTSIVLDTLNSTSFLLVLDARSFDIVAKANLGTIVPPSFSRGSVKLRT
ncbi:carotenoid oxygenase [Gongronella butleri]|nr:carotenoid oxygenase [Gongronella butleri]